MKPRHDNHLRQSLLTLAADNSAQHRPQPPHTLWLRAQLRERYNLRQQAIARATLPLRLMSAIGIFAVVLAAAFVLHQAWTTPAANPATFRTLITWTIPAVALVLTGCFLLLRSDRKSSLTTSH